MTRILWMCAVLVGCPTSESGSDEVDETVDSGLGTEPTTDPQTTGGSDTGTPPDDAPTEAPYVATASGIDPTDPDLALFYDFEGVSGPTVPDRAGAGVDGDLGTTDTSITGDGRFGDGLDLTFDWGTSVSGDMGIAVHPDEAFGEDWSGVTVAAWVWLAPGALDDHTTPDVFYADPVKLWVTAGGVSCQLSHDGGVTSTFAAGALPIGAWFHVACEADAVEARTYIDGALTASPTNPALVDGPVQTDFTPGIQVGWQLDGRLDELAVWRTRRGQVQICEDAGGRWTSSCEL